MTHNFQTNQVRPDLTLASRYPYNPSLDRDPSILCNWFLNCSSQENASDIEDKLPVSVTDASHFTTTCQPTSVNPHQSTHISQPTSVNPHSQTTHRIRKIKYSLENKVRRFNSLRCGVEDAKRCEPHQNTRKSQCACHPSS
jgi:hypothetical protein